MQKSQNYFQTTELRIMLALLALIDNPYQDIELAAVLRSPIVGLKENELAYLRINDKSGDYFHALEKFYQDPSNQRKEPFVQALYAKITRFMEQLQGFRDLAHQNELATLILAIYEQTGFLDYVGGMPGEHNGKPICTHFMKELRCMNKVVLRGYFSSLVLSKRCKKNKMISQRLS